MEVELRSGFPLVLQQLSALLKKNLLVTRRSKRALVMQLLCPLAFLGMLFAIDKKMQAEFAKSPAYRSITNPPPTPSPPITPCDDKFSVKLPCYDFVWSGHENRKFRYIVKRIMKNNPRRPIPPSKVKSFKDKAAVDEWLSRNPMQCPAAIHFTEKSNTIISYGIQTNSTTEVLRGKFEDPIDKFQLPLQLAAERELARYLIRDKNFSWNVALKNYPHPATPTFSLVRFIGPMVFMDIAMFNFILQMNSLVTEKELKLRQAMTMMGLYDSAYWLSWLIWETVITFIASLLVVLFGMMFQFRLFLENSFMVVFLVFFLFQLSMTGFAFMLSTHIRKSSSLTSVGFIVFIAATVTQVAGAFIGYKQDNRKVINIIWSLFPPNPFSQAIQVLSDATATSEDHGVSWSKRGQCFPAGSNCVITINGIYACLAGTACLYFVLATYFDNVVANTAGVRKSQLYFLDPGYWMGSGNQKVKEGGACSCCIISVPPQEHTKPDDEDVLEEENTVKRQAAEGVVDANVAVQIHGLVKTYLGATSIGCCKCKRSKAFNAVKGLWVNFQKDQLFCLLGHNGAGKTTVISCLTGISPTTDGDALIYGQSIRTAAGVANIRKIIGVCPQFDILWDALSGEEHLKLFATIKGLPPSSINSTTRELLEKVQLSGAAKVRAGSYSGGMKRRISVAIALIGDPKLVILDEPTTGMDPITRRHVWDVIETAKKGRALLLTTHSMEEADILSDRIAIMAKGRLRCIGTSIRLKSRFGTGFVANINFHGNNVSAANGDADSTAQHEAVKQFFKNHLDVEPQEESNKYLTFVIPNEKEGLLTDFFADLQDRQEEFGISDIQLGLATLEEVFLNIAKQAELESAAAEGRVTTLTLTSGESAQIPVGARFVAIPGTQSEEYPTGFMVEVYWEQDENGALCISGHSQKVPVPPGVQLPPSPAARQRRNSRLTGPVLGVVIDPSQVSSVKFQ